MTTNIIHSKPTNYGLDRYILQVQSAISKNLKWDGVNDIFGKIQPLMKGDRVVPSVYKNNSEYTADVFTNDTVTSTIAFLVKNRVIDETWRRNEVDVIVSVNLEKAFQNKLREDERAFNDIFWILRHSNFIVEENSIKEGNKNVWQNFHYEEIKHNDMHPFYVFSIGARIDYQAEYNDCETYVN